jgi:hypothetical protein
MNFKKFLVEILSIDILHLKTNLQAVSYSALAGVAQLHYNYIDDV